MRALVTGAAGFIGSELCRRLIERGHDVRGLDNLSDGSESNLAGLGDVELVVCDVRDAEAVRKTSQGCDVIFHQAAKRSVPRSLVFPEETFEVNVGGTINVLQAAAYTGARVVLASSSSVYGDQADHPLRESLHPLPNSPYAASKVSAELCCRAWNHAFGVPTVALRYFNVYGPRQDPANEYAAVVPLFIRALRRGEPVVIHGDGEQARDFTFVEDVAEANVLAAEGGPECFGRCFNVGGGGIPTSINNLVALLARLCDVTPVLRHSPPRKGDVRRTEADLTLSSRLLGYQPSVSLEEGLRRTIAWFTRSNMAAGIAEPA